MSLCLDNVSNDIFSVFFFLLGKIVYAKEIYKYPDKYFTDDIMEKLDNIAKEEYSYGTN